MRGVLIARLQVSSVTGAGAETLVLKAARLIDGRGGRPLVPAMVRVEGDRIAEVGERVAIPPGARVLELGDATLLPGLIDLHTHLTDKDDLHWEEVLLASAHKKEVIDLAPGPWASGPSSQSPSSIPKLPRA